MKTHGEMWFMPANAASGRPDRWAIRCNPAVMIRIKRVFLRVSRHRAGHITINHTGEVARDLRWVLDRWPMEISEANLKRMEQAAAEHLQIEDTAHQILSGSRSLELRHRVEGARDYQIQAADLALSTGRLLLTDELGLGKSLSGLLLLREPKALPALVVTLTHLPDQWLGELGRWFPGLRGHIIRRGAVYDPGEHREMDGHDPDVLIINYAKLAKWCDHLAGCVNSVVFDEIQELRRSESDKYRAAGQIADGAAYRMGLTATPVYNYGGEIYNIVSILAPEVLGSREEFSREWGLVMSGGHLGVKEPGALGSYLREEALMVRRTRHQVGRVLPEVVRIPHSIEADTEVVDKLTFDAADLARVILSAERSKEHWQASGDFDWKLRHATGVAKAPYVAEFVRMLVESGEQVILFGWHHDVYDIWGERLADLNPALYTGKESTPQKRAAREAFLDGSARILIMSLRSGAGLDGLQEVAKICVFGELDWSPGVHDQCIGRLHRDGQEDSVLAYFLVSEAGADPVMAEVLNLKRQQGDAIRDPDAEILTEAPNAHDRVRKLAEEFLARRGELPPAEDAEAQAA